MRLSLFIGILIMFIGLQGCGVNRVVYEQTHQSLILEKQKAGKLQGALEETRRRIKEQEKRIEALRGSTRQLEGDLESFQNQQVQSLETLQLKIRDTNQQIISLRQQNNELLDLRSKQAVELKEFRQKSEALRFEKEESTKHLKETYEALVKELEGEIQDGAIKITQMKERLSVNLVEKILFDSGSSDLKPEGLGILKKVGMALKKIPDKEIRVEGHTDNVPVSGRISQRYPSNWELSAARATTVARFLQEKQGVNPQRLVVSGYASYRPVASNLTPEGKALNRRIEIVLVPLDLSQVLKDLE